MPVLSEKGPKGVSTVYQQVFPIQSLHPEILAVIFIFCLPEIGRFPWGDAPMTLTIKSQNAPLLPCNVCSSWRNLAISTPQLWQTFDFVIRRTLLDAKVERLAIGIRTWLGRSGTVPLTINLRVFAKEDWGLSSQSWQVLEPLFQCASRWEGCHLKEILKYSRVQRLPVLREIDMDLPQIPFASMPCLKSLSLVSLPYASGSSLSAIPWDQLTELKIQKQQLPSMFLDIIRHCSRLQSLSLILADPEKQVLQPSMLGVGDRGTKVPSSFPITHNTLRGLHLSFMSFPRALLESIILPALIELKCEYCENYGSSSFCSQLLIFFTQSNCQLQRLSLVRPKLVPNELLECLKHRCYQKLTYLMIGNDPGDISTMFDKELLVRLTYTEDNKAVPICPKLAQLELYFCYLWHKSSPDLMGRMIQSRCFGRVQGDQLKSFKIKSSYPLSTEDHDLFIFSEEKGGLDLWIRVMNDDPGESTVYWQD